MNIHTKISEGELYMYKSLFWVHIHTSITKGESYKFQRGIYICYVCYV